MKNYIAALTVAGALAFGVAASSDAAAQGITFGNPGGFQVSVGNGGFGNGGFGNAGFGNGFYGGSPYYGGYNGYNGYNGYGYGVPVQSFRPAVGTGYYGNSYYNTPVYSSGFGTYGNYGGYGGYGGYGRPGISIGF